MATKSLTIVIAAKNMMAQQINSALKSVRKLGAGVLRVGKSLLKWGTGIGAAMALSARRAEELNKQLGQVASISDVTIGEAKANVMALSASFGLAKDELTKGLYDALSAGIPKDNVFDFLRVAAKAAVAGAGTTAEAVDILTTSLNAFRIPANRAEEVADVLFETVRLGKTTLTELASSFAQVAPLASASGVDIKQVAAAIATLTQQGTKTPEAMTQIRAALKAMNEELGDGWGSMMTFQQAAQKMMDKAGGSAKALTELTGRMEGALAIIQLTGKSADTAAMHLDAIASSAGAMGRAFEKADAQNTIGKIVQPLDNVVRLFGDKVLEEFGDNLKTAAKSMEELAQQTIAAEGWLRSFGASMRSSMEELMAYSKVLKIGFDPRTFGRTDKMLVEYYKFFQERRKIQDRDFQRQNEISNRVVEKTKETAKEVAQVIKANSPQVIQIELSTEELEEEKKLTEQWFKDLIAQREELYAEIDKLEEDRLQDEQRIKDELLALEQRHADQIDRLREDNWNKEKDRLNEELAKAEEVAKMTVQEFIDAAQKKKQEQEAQKATDDRFAKLQAKQARGIRLSRKDQQFVDAVQGIRAAGAQAGQLKEQVGVADENLRMLNKQNGNLEGILKEIEDHNKKLDNLLALG
jgi:TP901 family phage tail tape measure protein